MGPMGLFDPLISESGRKKKITQFEGGYIN